MAQPSLSAESVDALLFDLGGVVIDIDFRRCFQRWADASGTGIDHIASRFEFDTAYERHERGEMDTASYFQRLRLALGVDLGDGELLDGWEDIYVGVLPGIGPLLAAAGAEFPLYVFTNSNPAIKPCGPRASPRTSSCLRLPSCRPTSGSESLTVPRSTPSPK